MVPEFPTKTDVLRALIGSGFTLSEGVYPHPHYHLFRASRTEIFGSKVRYTIAVASSRLTNADVDWLIRDSERSGAVLLFVGEVETTPEKVPVLTYSQFFDRLGGPIFSLLPFDPEYKQRLLTLGNNKIPSGLLGTGTADALFEQYVHAGLQFLLRTRVIKNGQEMRGKPVPDGVVVGRSIPLMLYDAKAAGNGFDMSMEAVRQFADYADEFHKAYESLIGRLSYFLVISASFKNDEDALEDRSREVQARCGVPLSFLTAEILGSTVECLVKEPLYRPALDWHFIFARPVVRFRDVEKQLRARAQEGLLTPVKG